MKFQSSLLAFAFVALALIWMPTVASSAPAPAVDVLNVEASALELLTVAPALSCNMDLRGTQSVAAAPMAAKAGCGPSQCDTSCRLQGYDYGVCFHSTCICRYWFP